MDMQKIAARQIEMVVKSMGNLVVDAKYKELISSDRDPISQKKELVWRNTPIRCLVTEYSRFDVAYTDGQIQVNDKKVMIPMKPLNGFPPITIRTKNFLIIDSVEYRIEHVETDPTGTLCIVQARR